MPLLSSKTWTGVGSQKTPIIFKQFMGAISFVLGNYGYSLRSGRAKGADNFFEGGVPPHMCGSSEIYLPQPDFGTKTACRTFNIMDKNILADAMYLISKFQIHEDWDKLINARGNSFAVTAHTRNVFQCLSFRLNIKSKFLICWTPCGSKTFEETSYLTGGTRTAIRLAHIYNIPVFNLACKADSLRLLSMITKAKTEFNVPFDVPSINQLTSYMSK